MTFKPSDKPKVITSAKQLETLTAKGRYSDQTIAGLFFQVTSPKAKSWVLRYQIAHRTRWMGLGPYPLVTWTTARQKAREARLQLLDGVDPVEARKAQKAALIAKRAKALTFKEAAERYLKEKGGEWKTEDQRRAFSSTMGRYVFPTIGSMAIADIDTAAVLSVLRPIWKPIPKVAGLLRIRIEKILAWAQVNGFRPAGDNPARWARHLAETLESHSKIAPTQHHAAMALSDLPGFMAKLRAEGGVMSKALEFCILTATRANEVLGARWSEIDLDAATWTISANRMKAGREHVIPLSARAVAILESVYREAGNSHVFLGPRSGAGLNARALRGVIRREGLDVTVHGFRSCFRDWCGDHTEFPREIAEAALAHKTGDATEQSYRRGTAIEKRRVLMEAWARFCDGERDTDNVIELRGRAK